MKKLQKWLLVVLCVVLGLSVLAACDVDSHTHSFTEVGFDATNHWKYCKEDNVKDDASVKAHEYTETGSDETNHWKYCKVDNVKDPASVEAHKDEDKNGKCDVCGHAVKVTVEYGTLKGVVSLVKLGTTTASGDGVTIKVTNSKGEVAVKDFTLDKATGAYTMQCPVGEYTLKVSKKGYNEISYEIEITKNETVTMNVTLEYVNFVAKDLFGWDNSIRESYVDGKATVTALGNTVMHPTVDTFDQVAFTTYLKKSNTTEVQGAFVRFGEKYIWVTIKNSGSIEWNCDTWAERGKDNVTHLTWNHFCLSEWFMCDSEGNTTYQNGGNLTDEEKAMFEEGTLPLTLVRNGANVYVFVNGKYIGVRNVEAHLGAEIANGKVTVGLSCNGSKANVSVFTYLIETDISAYLAKCEGDVTFKYVVNGEHVNVTGKKDGFKLNDLAEITLSLEEGYTITSFKINGQDVEPAMSFKKWILDKNLANVTIDIVTAEYQPVAIEYTVSGLKPGYAQGGTVNLPDGKVKLENAFFNYELDLVGGKLTGKVAKGTYTLTYDGYKAKVTVDDDLTKEIALERINNFADKDILGWNNNIKESYADGKATVTALGNTVMHPTVDTFDQVAFTTYLKKSNTGELQGAFVRFGEKYIWVVIKTDGSIEWNCDLWNERGKDNVTHLTWNKFGPNEWWMCDSDGNPTYQKGANLTDDEKAMFEQGTLPLTLVRNGASVYVFVNGKYIGVRNVEAHLGTEIANGKVTVGLNCNGSAANASVFTYLIETDISAYLAKCEGDSTFKYVVTGEHVTVTGKTEGFKVNDFAEITIAVEEGYTITSFKINGQDVEPAMSFKKWILDKNLANVTIDIVTAEYQPVAIEYTVSGLKPGYAQGGKVALPDGKVKLENAFFNYELDLVGGKLTGNVAKGNYTLTYIGYYPAAVTVDDDLNKSITLNHINFEAGDLFWGNQAEEVYTDGKAWLALKDGQNTMAHQTKELFDDVAITLYADSTQTQKETVGVFVKFGNQFIWFNIKKDGSLEWNCNTWMPGPIVNITKTTWNNFGANEWCLCNSAGETVRLSEEEKTMFANGTLPLTLVRKGANVYAFLNGKYIGMRNVGEEIGASKVTVGLTDFGAVVNGKLSYTIETDISAYLAKCEGDSTFKYVVTGEHVTVTGKTEGFKLNDIAEITIAAEEGFTITSVKVNGVETDARTFKKWLLGNDIADVTIEVTTAAKE